MMNCDTNSRSTRGSTRWMLNVVGTLLTFLFLFSEIHAQTTLISSTGNGGFELGSTFAANGWTAVNPVSSTANQWYVGTGSVSLGTNGVYITNNTATGPYAYTNTSSSVSHFYRDVTVPAGEGLITLTFKLKGDGDVSGATYYDKVMVYTAPTTFTPTTSAPTSAGTALAGATLAYAQAANYGSGYTLVTVYLPSSMAGTTTRLIFTWHNDTSTGTVPAAIDEINLTSQALVPISGTYTINNTLANDPAGIQNFSSFTNAVNYINIHGINGPLTFNVADTQIFNENVPALTATGTSTNTITFQKSGSGARPKITPTGSGATTDFGFALTGADYIIWDGIDIDASAAGAVEYGLLVRNASATNGAQNNTFRNFAITLSTRALSNTSYGILQTVSSTGGGVVPTAATGANSTNKYYNFSVSGVRNTGVYLLGNTSFPDLATEVGTTACANRNTISNIGPTVTTFIGASGIEASAQSGLKIFNTDVSAVAANQSAAQGIYVQSGLGNSEIYRSFVFNVSVFGSTSTTSIAYGMRLSQSTTGTNNFKVYGNMVSNVYTSFTGTATATRYAIGIGVGTASATASQSYDVHNNTVSIGSGLTPTYSNTCLDVLAGANHVLRVSGNIFANHTNAQTGVAKHTCISATATGATATTFGGTGSASSYNDLYIANATNGAVARLGATVTEYANITTLQAAVASITNSISADPMFVNNNTDLHATGTGVNNISGFTPDASVTTLGTDIDCNSLTSPYDLGADSFTPLTCGLPTALVTSAIAYETATVSWTAPSVGTATGYNWEVRTSGVGGSGATGLVASGSVTSATVNLTGLTGGSTYTVYIQSDCSGDLGLWASVSLSTLNCNVPTAIVISSITNSGATLSWTAPAVGSPAGYQYEVRSSGAAGSGSTGLAASGSTTSPTLTATVSGLTGGTTYSVYVRTNCYGSFFSSWTSASTFVTECDAITTLPSSEPFATYLPTVCWKEGANGDLTAGPLTTGGSAVASWVEDGWLNSGTTGAAKINIYTTPRNNWLISPAYSIPASPAHRMTVDVAAMNWGATTPVTNWEADDFVEVLISTSGYTNWTVLETYNASNVPSNAGQNESYDLSAYAGQTVRFAFRAVEGATDGAADLDFMVDNFVVEVAPSCFAASGLTPVGATATTVDFLWTASPSSPTDGYVWEVRTSGAAGSGATGLAATGTTAAGITAASATGLTANTTYSVYVRANCGSGIYSAWTSALSMFTGYCSSTASGTGYYISNFVTTGGSTNISNNSGSTISSAGYGDFTAQSVTVQQTGAFGYTATWNTTGGVGFVIVADFNSDLDFDDAGETLYTTSSYNFSTSYTGSFTVPITVPVGSYRMRIRINYDASVPNECGPIANGETEDYTLVVTAAPTCLTPSALTATLTSTTSASFSWTAPSTTPAVGYEYFVSTSSATPATAANTGTASATTSGSASGLTPNTTYYVFVRSECTTDVDYSAWTAATSFFTGYCQLTASSTTYYISNFVTTGGSTNISNNTGAASPNGYGDFTAQSVTQQQTGVVGFTFNMSYTFGSYGMAVFVDYNDDLDFDDAGETAYTTSSYSTVFTNSFTVPLTAPLGAHRMRVVADYNDSTPEACGLLAISTGEVEDYTLIVTAAPTCFTPTAPVSGTLTTVGATVSWTAASPAPSNGYEIYVSTTNTAPGASPSSVIDVASGVSYVLNTLSSNTTYYWWVRSDCGAGDFSAWLTGGSFTTLCGPVTTLPSIEPFATYLPNACWQEGNNGDLTAGPASVGGSGTSDWVADGFLNSGSTGAAKINIYTTGDNDWLITPQYTIPASPSHRVTYDVGATNFAETTAVVDWETDDFVQVLISTSDMTNWSVLDTYNSSNVPSNSATNESIDLSSYAGQTVRFAFRSVEGVTDGDADFDFFIDNFVVEETPACLPPSGVTVSAIAATTATLSWTASTSDPASGYQWEVRSSGAAGSGATGLVASGSTAYSVETANATGLSASTTYSVYVRSNCSPFSAWTSAVTFTSACNAVTLPFTENFNPSSTSLECWSFVDANGDAEITDDGWGTIYNDFFWYVEDGTAANDDYAVIYVNSDNDDYLVSPPLPLTGNEWVTFDFAGSSATTPAGFEVLLSTTGTDPGDFTTTVLSLTNPTNTAWDNMYIDLTAYTGTVYLAWHIPSGNEQYEAIGIDNVTVELMPSCLPLSSASVSGYGVNWTASWTGASDVVIEYGPVGFTPGTGGTAGVGGTIVSGSGSSAAFVVPANASYDAYVRANCSATADGYSTNSGPYSFNSYTVVPFSGEQTITTCNTTIYDHAGPSVNYSNNADGTLVIYPGTPGSVLSFVGTFAAEGGVDDLIFYRGVGTSGSVLASYNTVSSDTPININLLSDQLDQPVTVRFDSDNSVVRAGFTLNVTCASACGLVTSFPAPTSTLASVCPGESFTLSFPTVPAAIGYTYQWYSSTGNGAPYVAISGQTGPTLTTTQTAQTVYACNIACAYGNNYTSAGRTVPMNAPTACYPVSAATNTGDTDISNVAVNGSNAAVTNTCGTGTYTNYTGTSVFNLGRGSQATLAVTSCDPGGTAYSGDCGVFIDFNQDGDFVDAGESVYQAPGILTPVAGSALFSGNFTIPATATLGATRMRVVVQEQTSNVTISATGTYPYGETEDYTVTIVPGVANDLFANAVTPTQNIYPSCSNMTGTLVGATDATAGVIGDDVWYKFVAQGTAYRVSTAGAAGDVTLQLHNASNVQITANVWTAGSTNSTEMLVASGLTVGDTYYVRVINQSATPSNFTICLQRFSGSGCDYGPNYSNLCSNFKATWCGASSYTVDFFDGANAYTRTSTGTTLFTLSTVVPDPTATNVLVGGLRYGTTYTTTVEANYIITDYSNNVLTTLTVPGSSPCSVIMGTQPDVALRSTDRSSGIGVNARALNSFVAADPFLCNLAEYLWEVVEVDPNNPSTTISPVPVIIESNSSSRFLRLSASTNAIFHSGGRYRIRIAPKFFDGAGTLPTDDYIGTYGSQYDVLIAGVAPSSSTMENPGTEVVLVDKINEGGVFASLYPNPNTGESVNLNIAGIESESVNISIMDASGRVVWSNRYVVDGALFTTVNFDRPLAAGMYMVEMVYNGQVMTQRMMVQK